jgi:hypothetical protein
LRYLAKVALGILGLWKNTLHLYHLPHFRDVLETPSIGRPDLRDKAVEFTGELYETLHGKLLTLPHYTMVFSTHHGNEADDKDGAYFSTIQESLKLPWLDISRDEFVAKVSAKALPRPMNYRKIIEMNKGKIQLNHLEILDLEIGPNRCAVDGS